ncbi:MAG: sodium:proton antiporter [Bifidobacteriaceae bacterium]|jgi:CPA1 family monovalent cation:H+ antiporter|nr:sodium:proton antiporter [Bifidobacteriaceae bacterium]
MQTVVLAVAAVAATLAASALGKWIRIGPPLLLVVAGMGVSLLPSVPDISVDPGWILGGVLPPLLYSSAIRMPTVDLRRNSAAIGVFSVLLVVVTAVVTGLVIHLVFPAVPLNVGIALGAVVSPTDAAAITIIKKAGAPARVVTVLSGESLLNDPTALVMLRAALAATVSFPLVAWSFIWAIGAASVVGLVVGWAALRIGRHVQDPTAHTVFSFLVPFAAYLPVEHLESSGLVAVVVAGLVVGQGAPRFISARNRLAQESNWLTVDMLAEGAVFLAMGLQLSGLYQGFRRENDSVGRALMTAALALVAVLVVRGLFTATMLAGLGLRERHRRPSSSSALPPDPNAAHLGWRDGLVLQWAGLRGVVTVAAAQTLPLDTPERPALILIAFAVAGASLVLQGGTLPALLRALDLRGGGEEGWMPWRVELRHRLSGVAARFLDADGPGLRRPDGRAYSARGIELARQTLRWVTVPNVDEPPLASSAPGDGRERREELRELRLDVVRAMRSDLLGARRAGAFPSVVLEEGLEELDREELAIELGPDQSS